MAIGPRSTPKLVSSIVRRIDATAMLVALLVVAPASPVRGQEAIDPDRPDVTNTINTVPRGFLQVELGQAFTHDGATDSYGAPFTVRAGLTETLEARIGPWASRPRHQTACGGVIRRRRDRSQGQDPDGARPAAVDRASRQPADAGHDDARRAGESRLLGDAADACGSVAALAGRRELIGSRQSGRAIPLTSFSTWSPCPRDFRRTTGGIPSSRALG